MTLVSDLWESKSTNLLLMVSTLFACIVAAKMQKILLATQERARATLLLVNAEHFVVA